MQEIEILVKALWIIIWQLLLKCIKKINKE